MDRTIPDDLQKIFKNNKKCISKNEKNKLSEWILGGKQDEEDEEIDDICLRAPFLPECMEPLAKRCKTGTFTGTLSNGDLILGEIFEEQLPYTRNKYKRIIKINGMEIVLKGPGYMDSFEELTDGELIEVSEIQDGLLVKASVSDPFCRHSHGGTRSYRPSPEIKHASSTTFPRQTRNTRDFRTLRSSWKFDLS